ncbi:Uncharacterised protein [Pragia fontium]|nr:Uncharacterised protein [Pragia fontium]
MRYMNNDEIMLGDQVSLSGGMRGVVVCCFENRLFVPAEFKMEDWKDYTEGVMVKSPQAGLIYYPHQSVDIVLINRELDV